ncbi:Peptidase family M1 [Ekhidna lutea]|uniref:Peptidase family M1 n=1 Tax=Ekhidna lutea TaxID=447679 RepID=A0A239M7E3_EKHLU|nr:M1 family metallopeptidase [Ekhidna lutea]SNT38646.1 Peptidase family M1 [Ekhidna lutea]
MKYNFIKTSLFLLLFGCYVSSGFAQEYWQQRVEYQMDIDFDVENHQFTGNQTLNYFNNSPDTLKRVFYHLYFNAFQPNSMMDVRSRTIEDPDSRVRDRISKLDNSEIGYHKVLSLNQDGEEAEYKIEGTVLEVILAKPLLPGSSTVLNMNFQSQVPLQIRRSGRDNAEGIDYSMAQWYPKMAEYDERGWHAHPYVAREFYAPWGDFTVNISIDKDYIIAGTGVLQNANEIGYGYEDEGVNVKRKGKKLTWKFEAKNVHDFVWAADPDYTHTTAQVSGGPTLHFFHQKGAKTEAWNELPGLTVQAFEYIEENFGEYPYPHYSIIQGGDGGMEYPMATLITGHRSINSLLGVTIHEALHSWYQGLLATNESYYAWMDEGFTEYAETKTMASINNNQNPWGSKYKAYIYLANSGKEEPMSTHSDHYSTNFAYSLAAYTKGAVALAQLNYIIGETATASALKKYYYLWRFKHPDMYDWIRVFEKESELELDWYLDYWVNTTHTIDYAVDSVNEADGKTTVTLKREGKMPMPMDVYVTFADGTKKIYYAPLVMMRGEKENESELERIVLPDWSWTHPSYQFTIDTPLSEITSIEIDESRYMADVNRENNKWEKE